jgi:hypothetical protein
VTPTVRDDRPEELPADQLELGELQFVQLRVPIRHVVHGVFQPLEAIRSPGFKHVAADHVAHQFVSGMRRGGASRRPT